MSKQIIDKLEGLPDGSLIQHGSYNDRIYLIKAAKSNAKNLPLYLITMAEQYGYSKIFVKIPEHRAKRFAQLGYNMEASIPRFYNRTESGIFMGYYLNEIRAIEPNAKNLDKILRHALVASGSNQKTFEKDLFCQQICKEHDVEEMAALYKIVFKTYPFPIHDPSYLRNTMRQNVKYFGFKKNGLLIALSSAEIDEKALNAEMTDFATLPEWRGNSLSTHLLLQMEKEMQRKGIKVAYTIARARSLGINIIFSKQGYHYGGRLKNNTNISGNIDSMNIWYKMLKT